MITFEDIKELYSVTSDNKICKTYTKRQEQNINNNNKIAKEVLQFFPCEIFNIPQTLNDSEKLNYLLSIFFNSGDYDIIKIVLDILKKYNYNIKSELLKSMQLTDLYFTNDINFLTYSKTIYGSASIKKIEEASSKKVSLSSLEGIITMYSLDKYLNIDSINSEERRGFCHDLTSEILTKNKDLYGAYYYIPLEFTGFIEHSVILDLNHNLVLDFANNIVIPFNIWKKFYNNITIFIKGNEFSELSKRCNDELGIYLTTTTLDSVQRLKRKKNS